MPWFYVDDAFADSKPVMRLPERFRNEAVGLWLRCGAWSAKEETDGRVPTDVVRQFGGRAHIVKALANDAELWEPLPDDENWRKLRAISFRNWEKWQKTRAENQARRKREADKKSTYRSRKKGRDYVITSDDTEMSTGDNTVDPAVDSENVSTGESLYPDPTQTLSSYLGRDCPVGMLGAEPAPEEFPNHCAQHRRTADPPPCQGCRRTREANEATARQRADMETIRKVAARTEETRRRAQCGECDPFGWKIDSHGELIEPATKCDHLKVKQ